jgi:hypothetical protein
MKNDTVSRSQPVSAPKRAVTEAEPSAAFTPGPWEVRGGTIFRVGQQALSVAIITKWQPEHKANARLIAAAPELFEALKQLYAEDGNAILGMKLAGEALAKALGQPDPHAELQDDAKRSEPVAKLIREEP